MSTLTHGHSSEDGRQRPEGLPCAQAAHHRVWNWVVPHLLSSMARQCGTVDTRTQILKSISHKQRSWWPGMPTGAVRAQGGGRAAALHREGARTGLRYKATVNMEKTGIEPSLLK